MKFYGHKINYSFDFQRRKVLKVPRIEFPDPVKPRFIVWLT